MTLVNHGLIHLWRRGFDNMARRNALNLVLYLNACVLTLVLQVTAHRWRSGKNNDVPSIRPRTSSRYDECVTSRNARSHVSLAISSSSDRYGLPSGDLCRLSADAIDRMNNDGGREWYIDTSFLARHEIQEVIDCAKPGDVLWLNSTRIIQPRRRIRIFKDIEIRQLQAKDASTAQGSDTKATMVCPPDDGLFLIKSAIRNDRVRLSHLLCDVIGMRMSSWRTSTFRTVFSASRLTISTSLM